MTNAGKNVHIDTYSCKPELISWRQINITVLNTRFLSPTDQKCADLSTYSGIDSSSIIAHPVNYEVPQDRSRKYYAITRYIYRERERDRERDFKFMIFISSTWDCTTFHNFLPMFKKKKFFKSWQVYNWLAKWLIMSGYMDLRRPRVYRRSNVGLVIT